MVSTVSERRIAGANIRRLREERDLSLTELARALDIERTYFHDIENGTANVTFEKYEWIAAFFKVTVHDLTRPANGRKKRDLVQKK